MVWTSFFWVVRSFNLWFYQLMQSSFLRLYLLLIRFWRKTGVWTDWYSNSIRAEVSHALTCLCAFFSARRTACYFGRWSVRTNSWRLSTLSYFLTSAIFLTESSGRVSDWRNTFVATKIGPTMQNLCKNVRVSIFGFLPQLRGHSLGICPVLWYFFDAIGMTTLGGMCDADNTYNRFPRKV